MKFLNYLSTLFIPTKMALRKNINVFLSFLILLAGSYVLAIPYMVTFEKVAYETYCEYESYNFRIFDRDVSKEVAFTDAEKTNLQDKYVLSTVEDLKKIDFTVKGGELVIPNDIKDLKDIEYNGKEYLLKREVYYFDQDGTKLDKVDTYYIHIFFDIFLNLKDGQYSYKEDFDKRLDFTNENHFLLVFYIDGFTYRNEFMVDNSRSSYGFNYNNIEFSLSEIDELDYVTHKLAEMLIPETKTQYTFNSFIYVVLAPMIIAFAGYVFSKRKDILKTYNHYYNIATLCSIPILLLFFILEWNEFMLSIGIMELYWGVLAIYYFIVLSIINRASKVN